MKLIIAEKFQKTWLAITLPLIIVAIILSLSSFTKKAETLWTQLGISESTGMENIRNSFIEDYMYTYGASAAKKIAAGDRVAVTHDLLVFSKEYVRSSAFKQAYDAARAARKPAEPTAPKTKEQIQQERIAELNKTLAEQEKSMKTLPPDLLPAFKDVQKMLQDQLKDYEDINSPMLGLLADGEQYTYKNAIQQYTEKMKTWEKEYPADHLKMVKARLEKFLQVTEGVDYKAELKEEYRLKKFVNPAYEKKSAEWKMAFRCGQPVVETARTFAKQWLEEIK